jgi:cytochrome b pre-mRNA-processing protein 3
LGPRPRGRLAGKVGSPQYPEKAKRRKYRRRPGATNLTILQTLFGRRNARARIRPLYEAVVALARDPAWYREGGVPDTIEGRFAMVAAVAALVLLRLESETAPARRESVLLTEAFIADMDSSLREIGIGDFVLGKHVGRLVGALGGRLGAFREAEALDEPVRRNVFAGEEVEAAKLRFVAARLEGLRARLGAAPLDALLAGAIG